MLVLPWLRGYNEARSRPVPPWWESLLRIVPPVFPWWESLLRIVLPWVWWEVYLSRHRPPCHPDIILSRHIPPSLPGWTIPCWPPVLVNGAAVCVAVCTPTRLRKGERHGWEPLCFLPLPKGVTVGRSFCAELLRMYGQKDVSDRVATGQPSVYTLWWSNSAHSGVHSSPWV